MNNAQVAELADALASGASDRKIVGVQVPPCAQRRKTRSPDGGRVFVLGNGCLTKILIEGSSGYEKTNGLVDLAEVKEVRCS